MASRSWTSGSDGVLNLERAVRVELTITGFAVQCLRPLGDARERSLPIGECRLPIGALGLLPEAL